MTGTPKTLTVTESHQLLDALLVKQGTAKQFRRGIRNYTMALLMLDAGLRVGEVVQLKISDLWFGSEPVTSIIIPAEIAKNNEERTIPISGRLCDAIKQMDASYWPQTLSAGFARAFYQTDHARPVTTRQVERIIRAAALKVLGRPVHPHILRHTFASKLMRKTNVRVVQELLGHQSITSTQIYTHPNSDDLKTAIEELNLPAATAFPEKPTMP